MKDSEADILLVEDNMDDAVMTIRALNKVNLADKVLHLQDGQEAIDFLFGRGHYSSRDLTKKPKVILLDIKMPGMSGIEVLRQAKSNEATRMIPVVMMTSSKEKKDVMAGYSLGVNSYVVKPVDFELFVKTLSQLGLYWIFINQTQYF